MRTPLLLLPLSTVVVASVISEIGGWLAIHADDNGQIGAVLGQTPLVPGTNPAVMIRSALARPRLCGR